MAIIIIATTMAAIMSDASIPISVGTQLKYSLVYISRYYAAIGMATTAIQYLLATITVFVVIIIVVSAWNIARQLIHSNTEFGRMQFPRIKISTAYPQMKTGDLIFMMGYFAFGSATGSLFTHAGVIVRDGSDIYISESVPKMIFARTSPNNIGGSQLNLLLPRLKYYAGHTYWVPLAAPLSDENITNIVEAAKIHHPYPQWWRLILGALGLPVCNKTRHCFQHVGHLLSMGGCLPENCTTVDSQGTVEITRNIAWISGQKLLNGNMYNTPQSILYDIDSK